MKAGLFALATIATTAFAANKAIGEVCEVDADCESGSCYQWAIVHTCIEAEPVEEDEDSKVCKKHCKVDGQCHGK